MKIGIIKFGLVIRDFGYHNQGGDIEIINLIDVLSKEHEVFIISKIDKKARFKKHNEEKLDLMFVFNGPIAKKDNHRLNLFKGNVEIIDFINDSDVPYIYIQSDNREYCNHNYCEDIKRAPIHVIGMQNDEVRTYYDFDKLSIPNIPINFGQEKTIKFGVIMNDTDKKRNVKLIKALKWLEVYNIVGDVKGKWKDRHMLWCSGMLKEHEVGDYLKNVKYTVNIAVEPLATSQKIWEYIMNDVICFCLDYDMQYNILPKDSYLRVKDENELASKIEELEGSVQKYESMIQYQHELLRPEYIDGSYVLEKYNKLINNLITKQNV